METKDWIIMFVPIVVNGVGLFVFQQLIMHKFKQIEKKTNYRQEILKEFLHLLKEFYETFRVIRNTGESTSQKKMDFATSWNLATEHIQKVLIYYDSHKATLNSLEKTHNKCIDKYQHMIDVLRDETIVKDGGYIITEKCGKDFHDAYWEMDRLIKEYLAECEKQILQFR